MGCCSSSRKSSLDAALNGDQFRSAQEHFLRKSTYDDSSSSSWQEEERKGPTGDNFPTWVKDEEVKACYNCNNKFNILIDRKHHCRRCRNIFCNLCSSDKAKILLFSITEEVRVCHDCFLEIPLENNYVLNHRPLLLKGDNFKKSIMMGFSTKVVNLRLLSNETVLVYDDESRSEPTEIILSEITGIRLTSLKAFEIMTEVKSYLFEADSSTTQKLWVAALNDAIKRAKETPFRQRIDNERRLKVEAEQREQNSSRKNSYKQDIFDSRNEKSNSIKKKYGNSY